MPAVQIQVEIIFRIWLIEMKYRMGPGRSIPREMMRILPRTVHDIIKGHLGATISSRDLLRERVKWRQSRLHNTASL